MKKNLKYYLGLKYEIRVVPIPESEGGGYEAFMPQLGRYSMTGDGETISEALADLDSLRADFFAHLIKEGASIPEPREAREEYSGKLLVRLPKCLHKVLAEQAYENGVSLNQHINCLLAEGYPVAEMKRALKDMSTLWSTVILDYKIPQAPSRFSHLGQGRAA